MTADTRLTRRFVVIGLLGCALLMAAPACSTGEAGLPLVRMRVDGHRLKAEVARSAAEQGRGLMYRRKMAENVGMLFVYESEERLSFWMKNTFLPLSIAFIDDDGTIVHIENMQPQTTATHRSPKAVRYALEMNQGWFEQRGIAVGAKFETPLP